MFRFVNFCEIFLNDIVIPHGGVRKNLYICTLILDSPVKPANDGKVISRE